MFQNKCIVCNKYKFSEEFSDEFDEKGGYGLICRDCLLNRQFIRYEKSFSDPSESIEEAEDETLEIQAKPIDKKSLDENRSFYNKIRIEFLDVSSAIREKLLIQGIRTFGGFKFNKAEEPFVIEGLSTSETEEVLAALSKIPRKESKSKSLEVRTVNTEEQANNYEYLLEVIKEVANFYKVSVSDILSKSRRQEFIQARFVAVHILRNHLGCSYPKIAKLLYRDHTTIIHADNTFKHDIKFNAHSEKVIIENILNKVRTNKVAVPEKHTSHRTIVSELKPMQLVSKEPNIKRIAETIIEDRDIKIFLLYKKGLTLEEITTDFKITRERVRQICNRVSRIFAARQILLMGNNAPSLDVAFELEKKLHDAAVRARYLIKNPKKIKTPYKLKGWSRYYEYCLSCGSTKNKHYRKGLCEVCGKRTISGSQREDIIRAHEGKCDRCKILRTDSYKKFGRDFYISRTDNSVLCMKCFRKKTGSILGNRTRAQKKIYVFDKTVADDSFFYKNKLTMAYGLFRNSNFVVLKNSRIDPSVRESFRVNKKGVELRKQMLEDNAVTQDDGAYKMVRDLEFKTLSSASIFCCGGNIDGWTSWKRISDGKTLDEIYRHKR